MRAFFVTKHIHFGLVKCAGYMCIKGSSVCSSVEKRLISVGSKRLIEESGKK